MANEEVIIGLDIGSNSVKVAVGQTAKESDEKLHIIGVAQIDSEGVNRGIITSIEDAVACVSKTLDAAEKMTGLPLQQAWIGITGGNIISQVSKGVVAVSKTNGEISEDDEERAIEAAKTVTCPPNYEILHVIPRSYSVDGQIGIKDPIGMNGTRLEVEVYIIMGLVSQIKNLTKTVYQTGLDINDLVLSVLATGECALTSKQKELGVAVVNIGAATTSLAVYEEGNLIHIAVIPLGADHITADIAIGLRTSIEVAEQIKLKYGIAVEKLVDKKEEINLNEFSDVEDGFVAKKYVAEIIEARVEEIFEKVDNELKKIDRSGLLPAGVILTGGGAKLPKIVEVAKKVLRLPAALGYPSDIVSVIDDVNDLSYTTAIGLVKWGNLSSKGKKVSHFNSTNMVLKKVRGWFRSLMP